MSVMIPTGPFRTEGVSRDQAYARYERILYGELSVDSDMEVVAEQARLFKRDSVLNVRDRGLLLWWETY